VLHDDGGVVVEDAVGGADHLQILVLKDDLVVVLLGAQVEAGVGQVGVFP
jgi:hypothetical protein